MARLERAGVATRTRGLAAALTLGKRDGLDFETKQAYRKVGASHLLALSGMHLGIVYGFLFLFFIRPIRFSKWRWHALPLILLCLWGYAWWLGCLSRW